MQKHPKRNTHYEENEENETQHQQTQLEQSETAAGPPGIQTILEL